MSDINPDKMTEMQPWMQIYGQWMWHADAEICGNRVALEALRDAIDKCLKQSKDQAAMAFASDGEGYEIKVRIRTNSDLERMPSHYMSSAANPGIREYEERLERENSELKTKLYKAGIAA